MDFELKSLLEKKIKAMSGGNYVGSKTTTDENGEHLEITFKKQDGTLDKTVVDFPKPKDGLSVSGVDFVGDDMVFTMSDGSEVKILGAKVVLRQYNALTADKLTTSRKINGVDFDGTQDIIIGTGEVASVNGKTGNVILNKSDIGLSNVDNTSDLNKPVSTATQTALNAKADATHGHVVGDVSGLQAELDAKLPIIQAYTKTQIDTKLNDKVDKIAGKGLSSEDYTTAEKVKLASLEDSKFKGLYPTLTAIELAYPTAESGAYAFVDGGVGQPNKLYNYSASESKWKVVTGDVATMTPAQVKSAYESNADTNAFTDVEKSKLNSVAVGATANSTDAQLRDRATHTGEQSISTITGLQITLDGKAPTSHGHTIANVTGLQSEIDKFNAFQIYPLKSVVDLNNEITPTAFSCRLTLPTNSPTTNAFYCEVRAWGFDNSFVEQIVREIAFGKVFRRVKNTAGWQAWVETPNALEVATKAESLIYKTIPINITKVFDMPVGIYRIFEGNTLFTDFPADAIAKGLVYGQLEVKMAGYWLYELTLTKGDFTNATKYFGMRSGTQIIWSSTGGVSTIPTETVITTGFNAGYSGYINYRVAKDGLKMINCRIYKTSDLLATHESAIILPTEIIPTSTVAVEKACTVGRDLNRKIIAGSLVEVIFGSSGYLFLTSCGNVTTGVRGIDNITMSYY